MFRVVLISAPVPCLELMVFAVASFLKSLPTLLGRRINTTSFSHSFSLDASLFWL